MGWLRLDDGFTQHPKVLSLKRADRWTWLELLEYCARMRNGGHVPESICGVLRFVTPAFLRRCVEAGLLEVEGGSRAVPGNHFWIHDFDIYNGQTLESRVAAYLASNPQATANEVHRNIGGKREVVLQIFQALSQNTGSRGGTKEPPEVVPDRFPPSRARAHPVPFPSKSRAEEVGSPSREARSPGGEKLPSENDEGGRAFAIRELLQETKGSATEKAQFRTFLSRAELAPFAYHSAKEELVRNRHKVKNECAYVRRIIERYVSERADVEPPLDIEPPLEVA